MTNDTLKWLVACIVEKAKETVKEYENQKTAFSEGLLEGYYEVLDMLKSRLSTTDEKLEDYGLDIDIDNLESLLKKV